QPAELEQADMRQGGEGIKATGEDETPDIPDDDQAYDIRNVERRAQDILAPDVAVQDHGQEQGEDVRHHDGDHGENERKHHGQYEVPVSGEQLAVVGETDPLRHLVQAVPPGEGIHDAHEKGDFHEDQDGDDGGRRHA